MTPVLLIQAKSKQPAAAVKSAPGAKVSKPKPEVKKSEGESKEGKPPPKAEDSTVKTPSTPPKMEAVRVASEKIPEKATTPEKKPSEPEETSSTLETVTKPEAKNVSSDTQDAALGRGGTLPPSSSVRKKSAGFLGRQKTPSVWLDGDRERKSLYLRRDRRERRKFSLVYVDVKHARPFRRGVYPTA